MITISRKRLLFPGKTFWAGAEGAAGKAPEGFWDFAGGAE
jgi:hypothetical protein